MIYLFANEKYGQSFLDSARDIRKQNSIEIMVVFSNKGEGVGKILIKKIILGLRYQMPYMVVRDINSKDFLEKIKPGDHGIIAGFNQIFQQPLISHFQTLANFHPSILPLYRGPTPAYWCLKNGEKTTGYTLHKVTEEIDKGEILFQEVIPIHTVTTPATLERKIASQAQGIFKLYMEHLIEGTPWKKQLLDSFQIYHTHQEYYSFPPKP